MKGIDEGTVIVVTKIYIWYRNKPIYGPRSGCDYCYLLLRHYPRAILQYLIYVKRTLAVVKYIRINIGGVLQLEVPSSYHRFDECNLQIVTGER